MLKAYTRARALISSLRTEEDGNAAEYGLIIGLVAVAIIAALIALGGALTGLFTDVSGVLNGVNPPAAP